MNIYLIERTDNADLDEYDSAVVAAIDEPAARAICDDHWPSYVKRETLKVELLGVSANDEARVILASFNAG